MNKNKVLFVDDEVNVLNSINRSIIDEQIEPLFAVSGEKALKVFEDNTISVIVSDMKMPTMSGLDLLKKVKEISPNTIRIVLSGYSQLTQILATVNSVGVFRYVMKPWDDENDFLPAIREAVAYYNLTSESQVLREKLENKNKLYEKALELNKNLIIQMSQSINNIKSVGKFMLKLQNEYLSNLDHNYIEPKNSIKYNKLLGDLYINYLNKSLVDKEVFKLSKFKEDLNTVLINKAKIDVDLEEFNQIGDYKLIKFVTVSSIDFLTVNYNLEDLEVSIVSSPKLHMVIKNKKFQFYTKYISDIELKLFFSMINQFLLTIGGEVIFLPDSVNQVVLNLDSKA